MADTEDRRSNPALAFLKHYWFLIVFTLSAVGAVTTLWFEVQYVVRTINPSALIEYNKTQAILSTKREIRWCLGKLALNGDVSKRDMLECAN